MPQDNVQPNLQPTEQVSSTPTSGQFEDPTERKNSKWRKFFVVLGVTQVVFLGMLSLATFIAVHQDKPNVAVTGLTDILFLVSVFLGFIPVINIVGLPFYISRQRPRGKELVYWVLSFVVSFVLIVLLNSR